MGVEKALNYQIQIYSTHHKHIYYYFHLYSL